MSVAAKIFQLFVAISEQARQRKELDNVPGLLESTSSYVVSKLVAEEGKTSKGLRDKVKSSVVSSSRAASGGGEQKYDVDGLHSGTPEATSTTTVAFRLLANLAYADGARRRIMEFDGLVLAAAAAVASAADEIARRSPGICISSAGSGAVINGCPVVAAGEAAAALLHRLSTVLGAEGDEDQLVAAGEALLAAVHVVSRASSGNGLRRTEGYGDHGDQDLAMEKKKEGGGDEFKAQKASSSVSMEMAGAHGLALEALSALLVLSWSDAVNLEAAAAIDLVVTDAALAANVLSLWRQGMSPPTFVDAVLDVDSLPASPGAACSRVLSSAALPFLSSVAHRPAGRSALIAADAASVLLSVLLQGREVDGDGEGTEREGLLLIAERAELLRLMCVLCASPAHRAAVRESLSSSASDDPLKENVKASSSGGETRAGVTGSRGSGGGGMISADDSMESEAAMEAQLVLLQGGNSQSSWECRSGIARLASLLGLSPPLESAVASPRVSSARHGSVEAAPGRSTAPRPQQRSAGRNRPAAPKTSRNARAKLPTGVVGVTEIPTPSLSPPAALVPNGSGIWWGSDGRKGRALGSRDRSRRAVVLPTVHATVVTDEVRDRVRARIEESPPQ